MLQSLSDFFLLISSDSKKITNRDLTIFYNFIVKKMPLMEQQYPNLVSKSLNISEAKNYNNNKEQIDPKEFKNSKDSKKIFFHFQKQIMNLFNNLIEYCYSEGIIKLNKKFDQVLKVKIDDKIKEKVNKKMSNNWKYNYNNNQYIKRAKTNEIRNFLIFLIINGDINFNIYPNEFVNFFNGENKSKNRNIVEQFMRIIKNIIKIYKENKRNNIKKINGKINSNTDKKVNNSERKKNKIMEEKNNVTDGKNNSTGIKSFNTEGKICESGVKSKNISDKHIHKTEGKTEKSDTGKKNKINRVTLPNDENFNTKKILKENKLNNKVNNNIIDNESSSQDEINDTIRCETPRNVHKEAKIDLNSKMNLDKKILNYEETQRRHSADKKFNKINNNRLTVPIFKSKGGNKIQINNTKKVNNEFSPKKHSNSKNQKKNVMNRNKKEISPMDKFAKYHKSLIDDNYEFNINEKKSFKEDEIKPINKSQSILNKEPVINSELMNINSVYYNKINENGNQNKKKEKENEKEKEEHDTIFNDKYNLVSKVKIDKNNNQFKDIYLYKNLEVHQHCVIYHDDNEKEEDDVDEDDIGCVII